MLVTSRRNLILGMGSLIAAPSLVKASSLMHLRGYDMDPWAIGYKPQWGGTVCSLYNIPDLLRRDVGITLSIDEAVRKLNCLPRDNPLWTKVRRSEISPIGIWGTDRYIWNTDG